MSTPDFTALVSGHRKYFQSGATRPAKWRKTRRKELSALSPNVDEVCEGFLCPLRTVTDN
jgi:hypothetical protein